MKNPGVLAAYLAAGLFPVLFWFWPVPLQKLADNRSLSAFLRYLPALALAGTGVMGWKLNQTRVLLGSFMCLVLYLILFRAGSLFDPDSIPVVKDTLAIALPLAFALAVGGQESPLVDRRFVRRLALVAVPFLILGVAGVWARDSFEGVANWAPGGWVRPVGYPWLCLGAVALYAVAAVFSRDRRIKRFALALGLALVPVMFALRALTEPPGRAVFGLPGIHVTTAFLAVSLILFHAVFSMYWHRVYMDDLTGIPNRRALEEELQNAGGDYAVAMIDIDLFKAYNDRFGHEEGDNVLKMVAAHLEHEINSRVYRYGGEEFCAVWREGTKEEAFRVMEKARDSLEKRVFYVRPPRLEAGSLPPASALGIAVGVTISAGLAFPVAGSSSPADVIRMADEALYEAKRAGRNRTMISPGA